MDKTNVMKALFLCGTGSETCTGCPYYGMDGCDRHMCDDALSLLKAKANEPKPQYHTVYRFTKRDSLEKWFLASRMKEGGPCDSQTSRDYYYKEREIQLMLLVRHEEGKCICRIKCPINPLPIKGEFNATSAADVNRLLASLGWRYKDTIKPGMFK